MADTGSADPRAVVRRFNDCINSRDTGGLAEVMSEDHVFTDTAGNSTVGKPNCLEAWSGFFEAFPDYRNVFETVTARDGLVLAAGHSVCAEPALAGPAVWTAAVRGGEVTRWAVHEDTEEARERWVAGGGG